MTQDMVLNKKYSKITVLLLLLLLMAVGNSMAQVVVGGSVYGGGKLADVKGNTEVKMAGGSVAENVFGGGKGQADTYDCEKAMVGVNNAGADQDLSTNENKNKGTKVTISDGTVNGSVYGGGEVGRVEWNTQVTLGVEGQSSGDSAPVIIGDVFGAGAGVDTHGYSALVRGNCTVIIQGKTRVKCNVYGGGKMATAGRYWVKTETHSLEDPSDPAPEDLPNGMPYKTKSGGECIVTIKDYAEIGPDGTATETEGNVFGAAKGVVPDYHYDPDDTENKASWSKRMVTYSSTTHASGQGTTWDYYPEDNRFVWEYFTTKAKYLEFLQTLGLSTTTNVTIDGEASIKGTVYGGGELGDVKGAIIADEGDVKMDAKVVMNGGTVDGNIFGGGKGLEDTFECEKAMVGVDGAGVKNPDGGIEVIISSGTVGGNVYGGGEVGRVEKNTVVTIGEGDGNAEGAKSPVIGGYVFGAGAGKETHGYSALVRGNCTVTVQGNAKVEKNVYGGGQKATAGRYWISGVTYPTELNAPTAPAGLPPGMPYATRGGGKCFVTVKGHAQIGPTAATETAGHVFGAGMGIVPAYFYDYGTSGDTHKADWSKRMATYDSDTYKDVDEGKTWDYSDEKDHRFVWEYFTTKTKYFEFLQTLALVTEAQVTIDESANVKGNIYGGSQSGFVQDNATVRILDNSTCEIGTTDSYGNVFGGGKGLEDFAEAGKVKGNTAVSILSGSIYGNVYGGGELGDVGTIDKTDQTDYNYTWKQINGSTANDVENNKITGTNNNTGICTVNITGGTIGVSGTVSTKHGNVFGASKGSDKTWWCEKAMVYSTTVYVQAGTIHGTVYGGGEIGRVGDDAKVTIGLLAEEGEGSKPDIKGNVFGAGAGLETHGYSALLRGNTEVTIQGIAQVGSSVYGGGKTASVGRFTVPNGLPKEPLSGGTCIVNVKDKAKIGPSGTGHNVFGACEGVTPATYDFANYKNFKSMQKYANRGSGAKGDTWDYYTDEKGNEDKRFVWKYYKTEAEYLAFLETLALTSHPHVTIGGTWTPNETTGTITASGTPTVFGSVYGGGKRGVTLGHVDVNIVGGTVEQDVYGGGALADTNVGNWDADGYTEVTGLSEGASVSGLYTRTGTEGDYTYTKITAADATYVGGTTYYSKGKWADASQMTAKYKTTVDLTGGLIKGDAYGGGLGQRNGFNTATEDIEATVWGDISLNLGSSGGSSATAFYITNYTGDHADVVKSGRIFGCNNLLGSPQGNVTVTVERTVQGNTARTAAEKKNSTIESDHSYELAAVYGGGNLAPYEATGKKAHVIINGCSLTSIQTVYGGGNAAPVPETDVDVNGTYEIGAVFGGGNGKDKYKNDAGWQINPGANVGTEIQPGNANTMIYGGTVHEAFGGSNEKGTIYGNVTIDVATVPTTDPKYCKLDVGKLVGAGKNADVNGNLKIIMGCKPSEKIPLVIGGADNANVNGDVELTVTSGNFGNIVGGNNAGGCIKGHIILNIEETTCIPLNIDHLYLCGYNAAYSQYGYYVMTEETEAVNGTGKGDTNETAILQNGKLQLVPRETADDSHLPVKSYSYESGTPSWEVYTGAEGDKFEGYASPVLNVISCTSIGEVFGGGYGTEATVYGNPTVNINMIPGAHADEIDRDGDKVADGNDNALGSIGDVYGGGDAADVYGNTTVNIGTATKVDVYEFDYDEENNKYELKYETDGVTPKMIRNQDVKGAYITGNVYGGGDNAIITGDTKVNICTADYSSTANFVGFSINNSVYGGGCNADVRGNTNVTMSGGYVFNGIFGGGYAGSVGTFTRSTDSEYTSVYGHTAHEGCIGGKPISCAENTGKCTVVVNGGQIGPIEVATEGMNRPESQGGPVPQGWVWGGGCGKIEDPSTHPDTHFETYVGSTDVTIGGTAFILESIIGGGEFGRVLGNTKVTIEGNCQIGVGDNQTETVNDVLKPKRYTDDQFVNPLTTTITNDNALPECSHFDYGYDHDNDGKLDYLPYDPYYENEKYSSYIASHPDFGPASTAKPSDGKTWIGCVFGGGSGYMPYKKDDGTGYDWCRSAGLVEGNATVEIKGGHILTNVYGGNEVTEVKGKTTVRMSGGTIGVPRTVEQIIAHPLTCYLFGAGKGDERSHFYDYNNVGSVEVEVSGGIIYGSVFGGSEDGNVLGDVNVNISKGEPFTIGTTEYTDGPIIGTWGTSYVDGNVFGGGRGFSGARLTAGNVGGDVTMNISGGRMLGSIYGGGRLGSVGMYLVDTSDGNYGKLTPDVNDDPDTPGDESNTHGHVTIDISGGTIGNEYEYIVPTSTNIEAAGISVTDISKWTAEGEWKTWKTYYHVPNTEYDTDGKLLHTKGGNVFAGGMGRREDLNGNPIVYDSSNPSSINWHKLGNVKQTNITVSDAAWIKSNVYGGGEFGAVRSYYEGPLSNPNYTQGGNTVVNITGGTIGTLMGPSVATGGTKDLTLLSSMGNADHDKCYTFGSVYGGGYGTEKDITEANKYTRDMELYAALIIGNTSVTMTDGTVLGSVYGGGEVACVGGNSTVEVKGTSKVGVNEVRKDTEKKDYVLFGSWRMGNVYGGGRGSEKAHMAGLILGNATVNIGGTAGIYHNVYGGGAIGSVGLFTLAADDFSANATVLGGTPVTRLSGGLATVTITGTPTIGINGWDNGIVSGSSRGDVTKPVVPTGAPEGFIKTFDIYDRLGWVNETNVTIGTVGDETAGPTINGSVYGGGENGHNLGNSQVTVNSGTIGYAGYDSTKDDYECGNVYGAGCGTDTYTDGEVKKNNPIAGIVRGTTTVNITGGTVRHNVYGAGSMASVGTTDNTGAIVSGGTTAVTVSGGQVGVDGNKNGNVFGAARGDATSTQTGLSKVKTTNVTVSNGTVKGNVYGGGESGDVQENTTVAVQGGTIAKNVFGGGQGSDHNFTCDKAMVGVADEDACADPNSETYKNKGTKVSIRNGIVKGNVYGGGEIGRVEWNTQVEIGVGTGEGSFEPTIEGSVFGAGKGLETHGYSALVRGNSTVTVQGKAKVGYNVYGGGEESTVGRYWVKNIPADPCEGETKPPAPGDLPDGMPYQQRRGGICNVYIQGEAEIGYNGAADDKGHVFGAGKGVTPHFVPSGEAEASQKMTTDGMVVFADEIDEKTGKIVKTAEELYLEFLQTLALVTNTYVTIDESVTIYGNVYGGSESGFVQNDTNIKMLNGTINPENTTDYGNIFGGGLGVEGNEAAGKVKGNTVLDIFGGTINGSVFGGGALSKVVGSTNVNIGRPATE